MKFLGLSFIKNKKAIYAILIYSLCYIFFLDFIKKNFNTDLYYKSTLENNFFFLFHGFFYIIIDCTLFKEIIKKEIIVRYNRTNFILSIMIQFIIYSILVSISINFISVLFFDDIKFINIYYTIIIMLTYCILISFEILAFYGTTKNIKVSFSIVNVINIFPIATRFFVNSFEEFLINENYNNIGSNMSIMLFMIVLYGIISIYKFNTIDFYKDIQ